MVVGVLAIVVCCAGPLLVVAIATTGVGAALAAVGWSSVGIVVVLVGLVAGGCQWLRRRSANECSPA